MQSCPSVQRIISQLMATMYLRLFATQASVHSTLLNSLSLSLKQPERKLPASMPYNIRSAGQLNGTQRHKFTSVNWLSDWLSCVQGFLVGSEGFDVSVPDLRLLAGAENPVIRTSSPRDLLRLYRSAGAQGLCLALTCGTRHGCARR